MPTEAPLQPPQPPPGVIAMQTQAAPNGTAVAASESRASSPDDDSAPDDDQKAAGASKRACDYCHRMKMKCINKESPPCNRCRQTGHPCTFNGPRKSKATKVEDRLKLVESQMTNFQSSLSELIELQRATLTQSVQQSARPSMAAPAQQPSAFPPGHPHAPMPGFNLATIESGQLQQPYLVSHMGGSGPGPSRQPYTSPQYETLFMPSPPDRMLPPMRQMSTSAISPLNQTTRAAPPPPPPPPPPAREPLKGSRPSSGNTSDDDDDSDPIDQSTHAGPWRSMLSLVEAARLKADNHELREDEKDKDRVKGKDKDGGAGRGARHPFDYRTDVPQKRRRSSLEDSELKGRLLMEKGTHRHMFKDPIELGMLSEQRGRQLYDLFMKNCLFYVPILDPEVDTFESLRVRSPFLSTITMLVGLKGEDGTFRSELQLKMQDHAEKMGMSTLFTPIARIEVVQALVLMSAWSDSLYRPVGHALRVAMEMGLWRCLAYLAQSGMGKGRSRAELEEERPLMAGARVWLTLFLLEGQHAITSARPFSMSEESIKDSRLFLTHPLSIPTDSRIVNFCELQTIRLSLHSPYALWTMTNHMPDLDNQIHRANQRFKAWHEYWEDYYVRVGLPENALLRVTLTTMLAGSRLYVNAMVLNGVRSRRDIALLSEERHQFIINAISDARLLMDTAFREKGNEYIERMRWANFYAHINFAFFARFLLRMSSLTPEALDLRQVGRDVERVAVILSKVPGFQFAQQLRDVLSRARRKHVLPPPSRPASPNKATPASAHGLASHSHPFAGGLTAMTPTGSSLTSVSQGLGQSNTASPGGGLFSSIFGQSQGSAGTSVGQGQGQGQGISSGISPHHGSDSALSGNLSGLPDLDFNLADQLFNDSSTFGYGLGPDVPLHMSMGTPAEQGVGFDAWFPFPQLDDPGSLHMMPQFHGQGQGPGQGQGSMGGARMDGLSRPLQQQQQQQQQVSGQGQEPGQGGQYSGYTPSSAGGGPGRSPTTTFGGQGSGQAQMGGMSGRSGTWW